MARFGAAELQAVAAVVGGLAAQARNPHEFLAWPGCCHSRLTAYVASICVPLSDSLMQEAIKLLTRQLVPLPAGGPLIYNAIEATTHTFSL